jgi:hypothetical protein
MTTVVGLLLANGVLGAVDTVWYHEIRAGLPRRPDRHRTELRLHAARDAVYAVLYGTIGWWAWRGAWAAVLGALLAVEIVITLADFVVEDRTRTLGAGERVLHSVMAIVYGVMLGRLAPLLAAGAHTAATGAVATPLAVVATAFGAGIALSGLRDLRASCIKDGGPASIPVTRVTRGHGARWAARWATGWRSSSTSATRSPAPSSPTAT